MARSRRVKSEREIVGWSLVAWELQGNTKPEPPLCVTITREAPRPMDDDGNVASAKAVRDQVAAWLGYDDGDARIQWRYAQSKAKNYAVTIEFINPLT